MSQQQTSISIFANTLRSHHCHAASAWAALALCGSRREPAAPTEVRRSWQVSSHGRTCNPFGVTASGTVLPSGYFRVKMCKEM